MGLRRNLRIDLLVTNDAESVYEARERLLLVKRCGESWSHVAMKLLAFGIAYRPDLRVEPTLDQRYKPDVASVDDRGHPTRWVECGSVAVDKLRRVVRANPHASVDVVKSSARRMHRYRREARGELDRLDALRFVGIEESFLEAFSDRLDRSHELVAVVPRGLDAIYLELDGDTLDGALEIAAGRSDSIPRRR